MIEGAAVLLAGIVIGWWLDRRMVNYQLREMGSAAKASRPLCSCGDPPSVHDPGTKECQAEHLVVWNQYGHKHLRPCPCRRYDGPEPLPEFYAPEIEP